MHLRTTLLASAAVVIATMSPAQAGGTYVSVFGGWNQTDDIAASAGSRAFTHSETNVLTHNSGAPAVNHSHSVVFNFAGLSTFVNSGAEAEQGWMLGAAVGGDIGHLIPGLRVEVSASYHVNGFGGASGTAHATDLDGATATASFEAPGAGTGNVTYSNLLGVGPLPAGITGPFVVNTTTNRINVAAPGTGVPVTFTKQFSTTTGGVVTDGSISTFAVMANAWIDFDLGMVKPYVGGGVGVAFNEVSVGALLTGQENQLAWQLGGGLNFDVGEKTSLGIGYRYMDAGEITVRRLSTFVVPDPGLVHEVKQQSVQINLTYKLPD
jgi:opacity protein-like surface antigen